MKINKLQQLVLELTKEKKRVINLSAPDNTSLPSLLNNKKVQRAFGRVFRFPYYKPVSKGALSARQAVSKYYKEMGIKISADNIVITSGTSESYLYLFSLVSKGNGEILFPRPSYPLFEEIAGLVKLKLKFYDLNTHKGWQPNIKSIENSITPKTKAIVIISPNNPTGSVVAEESLKQIMTLAQKHNLAIINDEVFAEYLFENKEIPSPMESKEDVLVYTLNGLSKTFALPGFKLSWIAVTGRAEQVETRVKELEYMVDLLLSANQMSQLLAPDIFKHGIKYVRKYQKIVEKNRNIAVGILSKCPKIDFHYPEGGFYMFPRITDGKGHKFTDEQFAVKLLKDEHVYVHPGYFYDYPHDCHFVVCFLQKTKVLRRGLRKIVKFINKNVNDLADGS